MLQGCEDDSSVAIMYFFLCEAEWTSSTCATILQMQHKETLVLLV